MRIGILARPKISFQVFPLPSSANCLTHIALYSRENHRKPHPKPQAVLKNDIIVPAVLLRCSLVSTWRARLPEQMPFRVLGFGGLTVECRGTKRPALDRKHEPEVHDDASPINVPWFLLPSPVA